MQCHPILREDINHLTTNAESTTLECLIITSVLQLRQSAQDRALIDNHADREMEHHLEI